MLVSQQVSPDEQQRSDSDEPGDPERDVIDAVRHIDSLF
jgi:hypothetical protein